MLPGWRVGGYQSDVLEVLEFRGCGGRCYPNLVQNRVLVSQSEIWRKVRQGDADAEI